MASYGAERWRILGDTRALPSAEHQDALEVLRIHEPLGTVASCRNAGAEQAAGETLIFLDADDELAPGYIAAMRAARAQAGDSYLLAPATAYRRGKRMQSPRYWPRVDLRDGNWLVIGTAMPRALFLKVGGFREGIDLYEDWCVFQRCYKAGATIVEVPDAIYVAYVEARSRNRKATRAEQVHWYHEIRRHNYPEIYVA